MTCEISSRRTSDVVIVTLERILRIVLFLLLALVTIPFSMNYKDVGAKSFDIVLVTCFNSEHIFMIRNVILC